MQIRVLLLCPEGMTDLLYRHNLFTGPRLRFKDQRLSEQRIHLNILSLNKQIHDEAFDVLSSQAAAL